MNWRPLPELGPYTTKRPTVDDLLEEYGGNPYADALGGRDDYYDDRKGDDYNGTIKDDPPRKGGYGGMDEYDNSRGEYDGRARYDNPRKDRPPDEYAFS